MQAYRIMLEEIAGRRFQTPLAAADQDGCSGEGEGGKALWPPLNNMPLLYKYLSADN